MKHTFFTQSIITSILGIAVLAVALVFATIPTFASAETYAYVDAGGDVRSVVANDWRSAINTAPNIHTHSGVLLLQSASDFTIVGDSVNGY